MNKKVFAFIVIISFVYVFSLLHLALFPPGQCRSGRPGCFFHSCPDPRRAGREPRALTNLQVSGRAF